MQIIKIDIKSNDGADFYDFMGITQIQYTELYVRGVIKIEYNNFSVNDLIILKYKFFGQKNTIYKTYLLQNFPKTSDKKLNNYDQMKKNLEIFLCFLNIFMEIEIFYKNFLRFQKFLQILQIFQLFWQTYIRPFFTQVATAINFLKDDFHFSINSFYIIIVCIRGMPQHSLDLIFQYHILFIYESNDQVRSKINNHNNNNIELIIKKKQDSINLQHLKVMYSFGHKRTLDNTRIIAPNRNPQFRTAKDLIQHMIDSTAGPKQPVYIQKVYRPPDYGRINRKEDTRTKTRSKHSLRSRLTKVKMK